MDRPPRRPGEHNPSWTARRRAGSIGLAQLARLTVPVMLTVWMVSTVLPALGQLARGVLSSTPVGVTGPPSTSPTTRATTTLPTATPLPPSDWYSFSAG